MDEVIEKREQRAKMCKLLAAEGYDVMLLPVVLGSAETLFKSVDRATEKTNIPMFAKRKYSKLHLYSVYVQSLPDMSQQRHLERQKPTS
jgi:hypothetical protein